MGPSVTSFPALAASYLPGIRKVVNVPNPSAGSDWSYTVPSGYFMHLITGFATFTTSAAVASRLPGLQVTDGNVTLGLVRGVQNETANSTVQVSYISNQGWNTTGAANSWLMLQAPYMFLEPGFVLSSTTTLIQAGDTYTGINLWFEQYEYGPHGIPNRPHSPTADERWEMEPIEPHHPSAATHGATQGRGH